MFIVSQVAASETCTDFSWLDVKVGEFAHMLIYFTPKIPETNFGKFHHFYGSTLYHNLFALLYNRHLQNDNPEEVRSAHGHASGSDNEY